MCFNYDYVCVCVCLYVYNVCGIILVLCLCVGACLLCMYVCAFLFMGVPVCNMFVCECGCMLQRFGLVRVI